MIYIPKLEEINNFGHVSCFGIPYACRRISEIQPSLTRFFVLAATYFHQL